MLAGIERTVGVVAIDVVPEVEREKPIIALPGGAERRCPVVAAVEAEFGIGDPERAIPLPMQEQVLAGTQHDEVHLAVGIDIERIGARHGVDLHRGRIHRLERERA